MKRPDHLKLTKDQREQFYEQLTSVHRGHTAFDFVKQEIDFVKCSSSVEGQQSVEMVLTMILPQAVNCLQKDNVKFGAHLNLFLQAADFEIPVF